MAKISPEKLLIGAHTSAAGGPHKALYEGAEIGATTVQFFTSNQKQWKGRVLTPELLSLWERAREETGIKKVMSHSSYLINLGSPKEELLEKSQTAFRAELERCHLLDVAFLNFHPGAATGSSEEECLETIVASLQALESLAAKGNTRLLLETTAGQGTSVGHEFAHLAYIIQRVESILPIGVCIDTCHIFAAGYDIRTKEAFEDTLKQFSDVIGLKHLYAFHVNDSMKEFASRRDRHAHLGEGKIGLEAFRFMMEHPKLREIPKYLETPKGPAAWTQEIALLRELAK